MKNIDKDKLRIILAFCFIGVMAILLCITPTRDFLVGVFGYAVFVYMAAIIFMVVLYATKKEITIPTNRKALYIALITFFMLTLHVATNKSALTERSFDAYLWGPFSNPSTVGGVLVSLLTFYCVPMGYIASLIIFYAVTAALGLMAIWPLLVYTDKTQKKKLFRSKHIEEVEKDDQIQSSNPNLIVEEDFSEDTSDVIERLPEKEDIFSAVTKKEEPKKEEIPKLAQPLTEYEKSFFDDKSTYYNRYSDMQDITGLEEIDQVGTTKPVVEPKQEFSIEDIYMYTDTDRPSGIIKNDQETPVASTTLEKKDDEVKVYTEATTSDYKETQTPSYTQENSTIEQPETPSQEKDDLDDYHDFYNRTPEVEEDKTDTADDTPIDVIVPNLFGSTISSGIEFVEKSEQKEEIDTQKDADNTEDNSYMFEESEFVENEPSQDEEVEDETETDEYVEEETAEPVEEEEIEEPEEEETPAPEPPKVYHPYVYTAPPLYLLRESGAGNGEIEDFPARKKVIDGVFYSFGIDAEVVSAIKGPTVTRYEIKIGDKVKVSSIEKLKDNLTMRLQVQSLRILAPIRGRDAVGIEIPNIDRRMVGLREIIGSQSFYMDKGRLSFAIGTTVDNNPYFYDLAKTPHLLVAGTTGSGKSCGINSMLVSWLYKYSPEDLRLILIDPKKVELISYCGLPHMLIPNTISEVDKAVSAIKWLVEEMDRRYTFLQSKLVQNIDDYNEIRRNKETEPKLPRIVLVIDEMADLMLHARSAIETNISRIAAVGRACGIHLVIATQRPSADIITGLIKSNIPSYMAFTVRTITESQIIMGSGETGAENLLSKGDLLFSAPELIDNIRMQGAFVSSSEIATVTQFIKDNNECDFDSAVEKAIMAPPVEETVEEEGEGGEDGDNKNEKLETAALRVLKAFILSKHASISKIQTQHGMGYVRAKKVMDLLEEWGVIGPLEPGSSKPRKVLITLDEYYERFADKLSDEDR